MTNEMMKITWDKVVAAFNKSELMDNGLCDFGRLNHCQAWLYGVIVDGKQYVVLKSYRTVITIWSMNDGIVIDALREVYGYTATSAQHISKFVKWIDAIYPACKPCIYRVLTWDDVKRIR